MLCVPVASVASSSVLVAYDGSSQSAKALHAFQSLGLAKGRDIHILSVSHDEHGKYSADVAEDYLRAYDHQVHLHVETASGSAAPVILAKTKELGVGLLVMGSYGQPRLTEWVFGSVTKTVLKDSPVPIFLYH